MSDWPNSPPDDGTAPPELSALRAQWAQLHALDAEPPPTSDAVWRAWGLFHAGQFQQAEAAGVAAGLPGLSVANRAAAVHATLLEPHEKARLDQFQRIHARARAHAADLPGDPNAWFWQGYALAGYAQGIHVARALAQGLGTQVQAALQATLALAPEHALAHVALGNFHAQIIDKVGPLVGAMTYGASAEAAHAHLARARELAPDAPAVLLELAQALLMLDGEARLDEAARLQEQAAQLSPRDAEERLWVELARASLAL